VPPVLDWASLLERDGEELELHYRKIFDKLGKQSGMLGATDGERQGPTPPAVEFNRTDSSVLKGCQRTVSK
jgi:hypothetical protein